MQTVRSVYRGRYAHEAYANCTLILTIEAHAAELRKKMARPEGFEPPTLCLEGRRSFQLSYGRVRLISHITNTYATARS
jgi:hypothetical protein